ncbi:MAG: hypothetical protein ABWX60_07365 [Aeromicrobium sp.]
MRSILQGWVLAGAVALAVGACTSGVALDEDQRLSWSELEAAGLRQEHDLAVLSTSYFDAWNPKGHVALIDGEGRTSVLEIPHQMNGKLAARGRVLCATTGDGTLRIGDTGAQRWKRDEYTGIGHWAGVTDDGTCVSVLNSGAGPHGYATDVYWNGQGPERHAAVRVVPGPAGVRGGAVWVRDAGIEAPDGKISLHRADPTSPEASMVVAWSPRTGSSHDGKALYFEEGHGSELFWADGRFHYLEDIFAVTVREGGQGEIRPGIRSQTWLASLNPRTQQREATLLVETPAGLFGRDDPTLREHTAVISMKSGHLHRGAIYTANGHGELLRVDLAARAMTRLGHLSEAALDASGAVAAWRDARLTLVLTATDGTVTREDYDLDAGSLTATTPLPELAPLAEGARHLASAALLD